MKFKENFLNCSEELLKVTKQERTEIYKAIDHIKWQEEFEAITETNRKIKHQRAYNKAFDIEFKKY